MNTFDPLPPSLVRFESQLEQAIRRRNRRPRHLAFRGAAVAAAVVIGVVVAQLPASEQPASAVERAAAALGAADGSVLHMVEVTTATRPEGSNETSRSETWQQTSPPYDERRITFLADGRPGREIGRTKGRPEVWNPLTNTLHTLAPDAVIPEASGPDGGVEQRLLDSMRALLASGRAHEDGVTTVDGRKGIRIVSDVDDRTLVVDAETYRPLEWTLTADDGTRSSTRIESYETLPPTAENLAFTNVRAQHPDAAVDATGTVSNETGAQPKR